MRTKNKLKNTAINMAVSAVAFLAIVGVLELGILFFFWFPGLNSLLPEGLRYYPIKIYTYLDRQLTREIATWDKELTYTLEPDITMEHEAREFSVTIKTNSIGVRDDEASLEAPDIIVIGDSFSMGFGVDQEAAFPQVIEHETGLKVLNTGIESYGTAREVMMLSRVDTKNLKYLVVQYCPNDLEENYNFVNNYGHLETMGKSEFDSTLKGYLDERSYFFGKYLFYLARNAKKETIPYTSQTEKRLYNRAHAKMFLDTLARIRVDMDQVKVIAFDIVDKHATYILRRHPAYDSKMFTEFVKEMSTDAGYPEYIKQMAIFSASEVISDNERFHLDGHINPKGHAKLARTIMQLMEPGDT